MGHRGKSHFLVSQCSSLKNQWTQAYIDHLHQQRLQYLDSKKKDKLEKRGLASAKDSKNDERWQKQR